MSEWDLKVGYAEKFGWLRFFVTPGDGPPPQSWNVPLTDLVRQVGIQPQQLRAHMAEVPMAHVATHMSQEELCDSVIPADLAGKTVLDIGGYDGRAARKAIQNGAAKAMVIDNKQYHEYGWKTPWAREGVTYAGLDFLEWENPADVVLFFNVIYHCPDPHRALTHLRALTKERMFLCSLVVWDDRPVWYPREEYEVNEKDPTVYWSPSDAGLIKLLRATGWSEVIVRGKTVERLVLECVP